MIASGLTLRELRPLEPFHERTKHNGMTFGVGPAGYDVRIDQDLDLVPGEFALASTVERFDMPNNLLGVVHDKSTWARRGITVQNTIIEPGWSGFLTLELTHHAGGVIRLRRGDPIAQVIFHFTDYDCEPYRGKYHEQARGPVPAILEG